MANDLIMQGAFQHFEKIATISFAVNYSQFKCG